MTLLIDLTLTLSLKFNLKLLIPEKSNPKVRLTSLTDLLTGIPEPKQIRTG